MNKSVGTALAPQAVGPYSQGLCSGGFVFCSGQVSIDLQNGDVIPGSIEEQTARALDYLGEVLRAAGSDYKYAAKCNVYLSDPDKFDGMNSVYRQYFSEPYPARITVSGVKLYGGLDVEIDCIAKIPE